MIQPSWKKILIGFAVILLLSRSGKILQSLSKLNGGGILTLEPLRQSPERARFYITLALFVLAFVTIFSLLKKRK